MTSTTFPTGSGSSEPPTGEREPRLGTRARIGAGLAVAAAAATGVLVANADDDNSVAGTIDPTTTIEPRELDPAIGDAVAPEASAATSDGETDLVELVEAACADNDVVASSDATEIERRLNVDKTTSQDAIFASIEDERPADHMAEQICGSAPLRAWLAAAVLDAGQDVVNEEVSLPQRANEWFQTFAGDPEADAQTTAVLVETVLRDGGLVLDEDFNGPLTVLGSRIMVTNTDEATSVRTLEYYTDGASTTEATDLFYLSFNLDGLSDEVRTRLQTASELVRFNVETGELYVIGEIQPDQASSIIDEGDPITPEESEDDATVGADPEESGDTNVSTTIDEDGNPVTVTTEADAPTDTTASTDGTTPSEGTTAREGTTPSTGGGPGVPAPGEDDNCSTNPTPGCDGTDPDGTTPTPGGPGGDPTTTEATTTTVAPTTTERTTTTTTVPATTTSTTTTTTTTVPPTTTTPTTTTTTVPSSTTTAPKGSVPVEECNANPFDDIPECED